MARAVMPWAHVAMFAAAAPFLRIGRALRRRRGEGPRILWGPEPLISIKYWSEAMRGRGYDSQTCVRHVYSINSREDFDRHWDEFVPGFPFGALRRDLSVFWWVLRNADVVVSFYDGGFLQATSLRESEGRLLRLAGVKLVVLPYGADVAVPGHIGPAEEPLLQDYPEIAERAEATRERVDWFSRWADVAIRNYQFGYVPRGDVLWPTMIAIDSDLWDEAPRADGGDGDVVIFHAPNHRHVKGTEALIEAVDALRAEGVPVALNLLEKRPNSEVRAAMETADIVGDQFIAGYAMFAIEGMAAGKPVMSALGWMPGEVRGTRSMQACPIVDTSRETLAADLRALVEDPARRAELGAAGRRFVLDYHSYESVARSWDAIFEHLWRGSALPAELPVPGAGS